MLVGDSMNRNQFESLLCLLHEGLLDKNRMYELHGHKITKGIGYFVFNFADYNCTVEFVRSHFLVRNGTRINEQDPTTPMSELVTIQAPILIAWPPLHVHLKATCHHLNSSALILKIIFQIPFPPTIFKSF